MKNVLIKIINFFGIKTRSQKQKEFSDLCDAHERFFKAEMDACGMKTRFTNEERNKYK